MDAIIDVTTAEVAVETVEANVITTIAHIPEVIIDKVSTSIKHVRKVLSIAGSSISAVAPDYNFGKELALAGA